MKPASNPPRAYRSERLGYLVPMGSPARERLLAVAEDRGPGVEDCFRVSRSSGPEPRPSAPVRVRSPQAPSPPALEAELRAASRAAWAGGASAPRRGRG